MRFIDYAGKTTYCIPGDTSRRDSINAISRVNQQVLYLDVDGRYQLVS